MYERESVSVYVRHGVFVCVWVRESVSERLLVCV